MTREEAIKKLQKQKAEYLDEWVDYSGVAEAFDMAIEALKRSKNTAWLGTERELDDIKQAIQARDIASEALKIASEALKKVDSMIPLDGADIMFVTPEEYKAQEWIPVSERLPEKPGQYLCNVPMDENDTMIEVLTYGKPLLPMNCGSGVGWYYTDSEGDYYWDKITAWMPLPEPYRKDGER